MKQREEEEISNLSPSKKKAREKALQVREERLEKQMALESVTTISYPAAEVPQLTLPTEDVRLVPTLSPPRETEKVKN